MQAIKIINIGRQTQRVMLTYMYISIGFARASARISRTGAGTGNRAKVPYSTVQVPIVTACAGLQKLLTFFKNEKQHPGNWGKSPEIFLLCIAALQLRPVLVQLYCEAGQT